jgi:flagellar protein FliS
MNYSMNRSSVYKETSISTSSPTKLVVMLYQGAIRFLRQAGNDIEAKDLVRKGQSVDRAVAIIQHLQSTLDMKEGRAISQELDRLYTYSLTRILEGSARLERKPIEEAIQLLTTLLSAWEEIALKEQEHAIPPGLLANHAVTGRLELHA